MNIKRCKEYLFKLDRYFSRSRILVWLIVKLRNQANMIISLHLSDGPNIETNGEKLLAEYAAPLSTTFVDVGANVGEWTRVFVSGMSAGRGLCVEPGEAVNRDLSQSISSIKRVEVSLLTSVLSDLGIRGDILGT